MNVDGWCAFGSGGRAWPSTFSPTEEGCRKRLRNRLLQRNRNFHAELRMREKDFVIAPAAIKQMKSAPV